MKAGSGLFKTFMQMLRSVGGDFTAYKYEPTVKREKVWETAAKLQLRQPRVSYRLDIHGSLRRVHPKPFRELNGRQRKLQRKMARVA